MSPLADPENPPVPPCPCRCPYRDREKDRDKDWDQDKDWYKDRDRDRDVERDRDRDRDRDGSRCRRLVPVVAAAVAAAALGAAAAAAAILALLREEPPPQAATAAHVLLSPGSLPTFSNRSWHYEPGVEGVFPSADVLRDSASSLRVARGGLYLLYGQLSLSCATSRCPPGRVVLRVLRGSGGSRWPLLEVPVELPSGLGSHRARSPLAQGVARLDEGDTLSLRVTPEGGHEGWQLAQDESEGNFVGLLRIAGG
ncbi:uncharacterized protein LOC120323104 [Pipra filicauda]|uniref:Uncharacterized protein LOC120323104 n=1 Tax=Pipra filicauda TaxID=649802 RepID=A0A7R5KHL6_9PASS|nr:uncharacterized protein LOC120323104 [Pipra filicauda]